MTNLETNRQSQPEIPITAEMYAEGRAVVSLLSGSKWDILLPAIYRAMASLAPPADIFMMKVAESAQHHQTRILNEAHISALEAENDSLKSALALQDRETS